MIISHKYQFIFIKTFKTASTSIEVYLSDHCGELDVLTPIEPVIKEHCPRNFHVDGFYNHISALEVKSKLPETMWQNYFKFCVERNPWDKTLSHFYMLKYASRGHLSLDDYFLQGRYCLNYPLYTDHCREVMVDKVIKYEYLNQELGLIFKNLSIPFNGVLDIRAKAQYRPVHSAYRKILSNEQRKKIQQAFQEEIELHDYKF